MNLNINDYILSRYSKLFVEMIKIKVILGQDDSFANLLM